jgi:regulator of sigma E protease
MLLEVFIIIVSISLLVTIHELGHFLIAKRLGIKVEEFGIGYPPRIIAKKIGETVYSLNLIPFGGFVRISGEEGEEGESKDEKLRSFLHRPYWQKSAVIVGGVLAFWIISWPLFTAALYFGNPISISDEEINPDAQVRILEVAPHSPAKNFGLKSGDIIKKIIVISHSGEKLEEKDIEKVKDVVELSNEYKGEIFQIFVQRKAGEKTIEVVTQADPPKGQGPIGISLIRVTQERQPMVRSIKEGLERVFQTTKLVIYSFGLMIKGIFDTELRESLNVQVVGPIGIGAILNQTLNWGVGFYLNFIGLIAIYLAIVNLLPIPATDGGRLLFLTIEKVRGKPFNKEIENKIHNFFFILLLILLIIISIRDIERFIL